MSRDRDGIIIAHIFSIHPGDEAPDIPEFADGLQMLKRKNHD
jgi:hypothetical protein